MYLQTHVNGCIIWKRGGWVDAENVMHIHKGIYIFIYIYMHTNIYEEN